jgi:hypothetical protein
MTTESLFHVMAAFGVTLAIGLVFWVLDLGFLIVAAGNCLFNLWDRAYRFDGWTLYGFIPMIIILGSLAVKRCRDTLNLVDRQAIALIEVCSYALGLLGTLQNLKLLAQGSGLALQSAMSAFNPLETGIGLWLACQLIGWQFGPLAEQSHPISCAQDKPACPQTMASEPQESISGGTTEELAPDLALQQEPSTIPAPDSPARPEPAAGQPQEVIAEIASQNA